MGEGLGKWGHVPDVKEPIKIEPKLFIWLIGLIVLWFVVAALIPMVPPAEEGEATVIFKAVAGESEILNKTVVVETGTNAFDAMQQAATVGFEDYGEMGVMVTSINGVKPAQNEFWKLFVNGEEAQVGISSLVIEEDTTFEWKTEEMQAYTE